jgi:hypothetical protein
MRQNITKITAEYFTIMHSLLTTEREREQSRSRDSRGDKRRERKEIPLRRDPSEKRSLLRRIRQELLWGEGRY